MLKMAVGHTEELDGEFAAKDILAQCADALEGLAPQAGLLLASHDLDIDDFLAAVLAEYPEIELIGCTTMAPMSSASEYTEGSTTLTLFASDVLAFSTGLGRDVSVDANAAVRQAVDQAAGKTDKPPALVIVTPTMELLDPASVTSEMGAILGADTPVFGGGAVPPYPLASPWVGAEQIYNGEVISDSLPILLISGELNVSVGVAHGWHPVGRTAVVTRADDHSVYEIDGEPVINFYRHYLGEGSEPSIANPLAILDEGTNRYYLRTALTYNEADGSAGFFGSVPEGSTVQLTMATNDQILTGAESSLAEALASFPSGANPEAMLIASCATRNLILGTRARGEIERIVDGLDQDIPVSGFYAYGEIAPLGSDTPVRFHNGTCVTVLFGT
jgi:hypothetical protein